MSDLEDDVVIAKRCAKPSKLVLTDDDDSDVPLSATTTINEKSINSAALDSDSSDCSSGKSSDSVLQSKSSPKSSQSICSTKSGRSRRSSSSSSSEAEMNSKSIISTPKSSRSSLSPSRRSSQSSTCSSPNSQRSRTSASSPSQRESYSRRSHSPESTLKASENDSESDGSVTVFKRSRLAKVVDSDENGSDIDISVANESDEKRSKSAKTDSDENGSDIDISIANGSFEKASSPHEETTNNLENSQTEKRKKKKYFLAVDSESDDSENRNEAASRVSENEEIGKTDDESNSCNMTAKEKRKMRLGKLNEKKKREFAELAESKTRKNKKDQTLDATNNGTPDQPQEDSLQTQPRKFLLLSDDDFSDNDTLLEKSLTNDDEKSSKKKKPVKPRKPRKKRENNGTDDEEDVATSKTKSKKRKNQVMDGADSENSASAKQPKKPRSKAPKSADGSNKELKESKQKSKKQQEAMLEIKSTTQKMIREGRITLPYHQPKQRSLDEFLQRRNNVPSIPLRSSHDILTIAGERLSKKEEEIAEFYKSESEHSEEEQTINEMSSTQAEDAAQAAENLTNDEVMNCDTAQPVENLTNDVVMDCDAPKDDTSTPCVEEGVANDVNECKIDSTYAENKNLEVTINPEQVQVGVIADAEVNDDAQETLSTTEPTAVTSAISEESNPEKVSNSNSSSNFDSNSIFDVQDKHSTPEVVEESSTNEVSPIPHESPVEPDTDSFQLQVEDSCPIEANTESFDSIPESDAPKPIDPPKRIDPETLRAKKLALLSSMSRNLSDIKLKKDEHSVLQFEIESAPKSGIDKFMEKFAHHLTATNKTKPQPTKLSVTNVQTDSEGGIVDIVKETLTLRQLNDEKSEAKEKFLLPGSKFSFFKNEMLKTMVSKKTSDWKKYQEEKYSMYGDGDYGNEDIEDDENLEQIGGRKLNFEPYHPEDEPEDDELVEDDVDLTDKRDRKKNQYLDEEAEVDFDEDENLMGASEEDGDSNDEDNFEDAENSDEEEEENRKKASDEENFEDAENFDNEKKNEEKEVDSDEELLNSLYNSVDKPMMKKPQLPTKLFQNEVTGMDLENKVLGLENTCTQSDQLDDFSNTQLFGICSGKFATQAPPSQFSKEYSQFPDESQDFNLSMQETNDGFCEPNGRTANSVNTSSFLLSDESDTEELFNKKKKTVALVDSDEESEVLKSDNENEADENDELDDGANGDEEEQDLQSDDELDGDIGYNSEEEIVDYKKTAPTEFFENEAELSESEWGSEDENEKDLDQLEREAGDDDDIDTENLKEELGRIHMRQMLDDDQKDVRLLQEILLEDGELHSDGQRNRKFQWKNLDGEGFFANPFGDSDDEKLLIDDDELNVDDDKAKNWRQMRHEREMFLLKQEKNNDLLLSAEDEEGSNILRVSRTTKITMMSTAVTEEPTKPIPPKSPSDKFSRIVPKMKCGSFLNRGQSLLNRIAGTVAEKSKENIRGAKSGRNFVFAAISPEKEQLPEISVDNKTEKRKISSKAVMAAKKLKLNNRTNNESAPMRSGLLAQLALSDS